MVSIQRAPIAQGGNCHSRLNFRRLLLHVPRATDSGKSASFIAASDKDRSNGNWQSGGSSQIKE